MCKLFVHRGIWRVPVICATRVRKSYITNSMETSCLEVDSRITSMKREQNIYYHVNISHAV